MRRAARADANQREIVAALRQVGATVQHLHQVGHGCPDILVGYRSENYLLEIKRPGELLTAREYCWRSNWRGVMHVVHSPEEALRAIGALNAEA